MLAKPYRLTWRDIQYMLRRGNKNRWTYFWVITVPQYSSRSYHQRSVQISTKVDKRATMRNELKRIAREVFDEELKKVWWVNMKKRFIFINKKWLDSRVEKCITLPKSDRKTLWKSYCQNDFSRILRKCSSSQWYKTPLKHSRTGGRKFQKVKNKSSERCSQQKQNPSKNAMAHRPKKP